MAYYACVIIPHLISSLPFVDFASKELRRGFARGINDGFERRDDFGRRYYCWIVCICAGRKAEVYGAARLKRVAHARWGGYWRTPSAVYMHCPRPVSL